MIPEVAEFLRYTLKKRELLLAAIRVRLELVVLVKLRLVVRIRVV